MIRQQYVQSARRREDRTLPSSITCSNMWTSLSPARRENLPPLAEPKPHPTNPAPHSGHPRPDPRRSYPHRTHRPRTHRRTFRTGPTSIIRKIQLNDANPNTGYEVATLNPRYRRSIRPATPSTTTDAEPSFVDFDPRTSTKRTYHAFLAGFAPGGTHLPRGAFWFISESPHIPLPGGMGLAGGPTIGIFPLVPPRPPINAPRFRPSPSTNRDPAGRPPTKTLTRRSDIRAVTRSGNRSPSSETTS